MGYIGIGEGFANVSTDHERCRLGRTKCVGGCSVAWMGWRLGVGRCAGGRLWSCLQMEKAGEEVDVVRNGGGLLLVRLVFGQIHILDRYRELVWLGAGFGE